MNNFLNNFQKYKIDLIDNGVKLPAFNVTENMLQKVGLTGDVSPEDFLLALCHKGLEKRIGGKKHPEYQKYYDQMMHEFGVLKELGFCEYLLTTWDIVNFCKESDITTGYGRGSAAGSIILWLVGVTEIDSIKYNLYFERFLNKTRAKFVEIDGVKYYDGSLLFDVDLDISFSDRQRVIEYIESKYPQKTSKLLTVTTLTTKILIKEVCKSMLGYSEEMANEISNMILKEHGKVKSIQETRDNVPEFKRFCDAHPEVINVANKLSGLVKNFGVHPSACIISDAAITDTMPLQLTKDKETVTGYTMDDSLNMAIKVDILGLRSATLLGRVSKMLNVNINDLDLNDKFIYDNLKDLKCEHGLFQIEAETNYNVCRKVKPRNLDHLAAIVALGRPGTSQFVDQYAEYVETGKAQSVHDFFDDVLKLTAGVPLYQESLLTMSKKLGFSLIEGETLRRLVGKKKLDEVQAWKKKIEDKIAEKNLDPKIGEVFWDLLEASANYSFNAAHAYSYASMCAATVYFKFKHPREFYLCLLELTQDEPNPIEEISKIQKELQFFNIDLLPPLISESDLGFKLEGPNIRFGLGALKGVKEKSLSKLLNFKKRYSNKFEIFAGANASRIPLNIFNSIVLSGGLDNMLTVSRDKTYMEFYTWNILTDREKKYVLQLGEKYKYNLFTIIKELNENIKDEKGRPIIKDSRRLTIRKHITPQHELFRQNSKNSEVSQYFFENLLMGFCVSTSLKKIFSKFSSDLLEIQEIHQSLDGERVHFASEVVEVKRGKSKAKGTPYLKMNVKDGTGTITVLTFNTARGNNIDQCEDNNGRLPIKGDLVVIRGQKKGDAIFANRISIQDIEIYKKVSEVAKKKKKKH